MENDILLQKELASVKADKKLSEEELVKHKSSMAEQIMLQMQGMTKNDSNSKKEKADESQIQEFH